MRSRLIFSLLTLTLVAAAPQPRKTVEVDRFLGRWYEAARTPNGNQKNCWAPTLEWTRTAPRKFAVTQVCHKGSVKGPTAVMRGTAAFSDTHTNAKMVLAFFGGVVKQEYWILDHDDDYRWAVVGTPGGNFVWVMSRTAVLAPAERDEALMRLRAMGYDSRHLEYAGLTPKG